MPVLGNTAGQWHALKGLVWPTPQASGTLLSSCYDEHRSPPSGRRCTPRCRCHRPAAAVPSYRVVTQHTRHPADSRPRLSLIIPPELQMPTQYILTPQSDGGRKADRIFAELIYRKLRCITDGGKRMWSPVRNATKSTGATNGGGFGEYN